MRRGSDVRTTPIIIFHVSILKSPKFLYATQGRAARTGKRGIMDKKAEKARTMRYKKAMLAGLNFDDIITTLFNISEECGNYEYYFNTDDDTLLNALDGDEEEEYEFKMMFTDLCCECENLNNIINDYSGYVSEYFDDFFVGIMRNGTSGYNMIGYDSYEEDYFTLSSYERRLAENESAKRIKRMTKDEILLACGQCFGIAVSFYNVQYKYDYLRAAFDILRDRNTARLEIIKDIEKAYNAAESAEWYDYSDEVKQFNRLINTFDAYDKIWIE